MAQRQDFKLHTGAKLGFNITKDLDAVFEIQERIKNNASQSDRLLFEPALRYKFNKNWRIGALYRYTIKQDFEKQQESFHRSAVHVRYKYDILDFTLKYRSLLQYGFEDLVNVIGGDNKLVHRNMAELEYAIFGTKISPSVGFEIFHHINHPNGGILYQWRTSFGANYKINKQSSISLNFLYENEFNLTNTTDASILYISYSFSL